MFEVSVSKLEGLTGWDLGSPAKAAVGHGRGVEELQSPSGCSSSWVVVAAGHGAGRSHTPDFEKVVVIKNPSSRSPAIASNLTSLRVRNFPSFTLKGKL